MSEWESLLNRASTHLQQVAREARKIKESTLELKAVDPQGQRITMTALMKMLISLMQLEAELKGLEKEAPKVPEKPPEKPPVQLPPESVWREFTTSRGVKAHWCFPEEAKDLYNFLKSGQKYSDENYTYRLSQTPQGTEFVQRWPRRRGK